MKRIALIVLLIVSCAALADEGRKTFDPARWREEIDAFKAADAEQPPPEHAVLFVGSSTIRLWDTAERFEGTDTINRGFGGSKIQDVLAYLDEVVLKYRPRVVVFYSGDNDVAGGQPAEYVADDFRTFTERTLEALPDTRIVLLAIKPSVKRWNLWPIMADANARMADICADNDRLTYLDLSQTVLNEDGEPNPDAFTDGLHLTPALYDVWTQRVKDTLTEIDAAATDE